MSFENFPTTENPENPPVHNNRRNYLTGALVIALLGTWGYIIWDKNQTKETLQQKETVINTTTSQRDELQRELDDATMRYDMIKTSSANMVHRKDSIITQRDRDIAKKKDEIHRILAKSNATKEELAQAKTLIASLNGDIDDFKTKIEKLEGEKIVLLQEKDDITRQRDLLTRDFDSTKNVLKQQEDVIDIGSTLQAGNFSIIGINEKSSGKDKETNTAKRVDKLRISFELEANRITQTGTKELFICITAPDGTMINGGKFNTRDGKEKNYTQKLNVNYTQGQRSAVSFEWKQSGPFQTGEYKIEIYNNGFKIGEAVRPLKRGGLFS